MGPIIVIEDNFLHRTTLNQEDRHVEGAAKFTKEGDYVWAGWCIGPALAAAPNRERSYVWEPSDEREESILVGYVVLDPEACDAREPVIFELLRENVKVAQCEGVGERFRWLGRRPVCTRPRQ